MTSESVGAPREARAKLAWPPVLRRSLSFSTLFSVLPPLLRRPLFISTPSVYRALFVCASPPFCVGNLKNGGHRLLRLGTIDFATPKVVGSKKEQILFLAPVLLSSRSISCLKWG